MKFDEKHRANLSKAKLGNKYRMALKDPDIRQKAYEQYCAHLAKGLSKKTWVFKHPEFTCTAETFDKYLKDTEEFDPIHKKVALAQGNAIWEKHVIDSALGDNEKANTASLQMFMRNTYGWDKKEKEDVDEENEQALEQMKALMNQLKSRKKD